MSFPAPPDQSPPGALNGGIVNAGGSWLPAQAQPQVIGPAVTVAFDVKLAYLGSTGTSIETIVTSAKIAIARYMNAAAPGSTVDMADILTLLYDVPGVTSVRYGFFGPAPAVVDGVWTAAASTYQLDSEEVDYLLASSVDARDVRIVP